ncbi:hypothetical protein LCGC14_3128410, partial [marine sediment metagenome]
MTQLLSRPLDVAEPEGSSEDLLGRLDNLLQRFDDLGKPVVDEEEIARREQEAIGRTQEDPVFRTSRELEIERGEVSDFPLRRFNQIRSELGLPPAEQIPEELVADTSDRAINAAKQALRGFTETTNRAVEGVGDMVDAITELVGIDFEPPSEFFESARNVVRAFLPDDPRLRDEFLSSRLPAGLGSTAAFFVSVAGG